MKEKLADKIKQNIEYYNTHYCEAVDATLMSYFLKYPTNQFCFKELRHSGMPAVCFNDAGVVQSSIYNIPEAFVKPEVKDELHQYLLSQGFDVEVDNNTLKVKLSN